MRRFCTQSREIQPMPVCNLVIGRRATPDWAVTQSKDGYIHIPTYVRVPAWGALMWAKRKLILNLVSSLSREYGLTLLHSETIDFITPLHAWREESLNGSIFMERHRPTIRGCGGITSNTDLGRKPIYKNARNLLMIHGPH